MTEDETDSTLLKRFRGGDEAAFETLFVRHYAAVYRVLYGIAGAREPAEDLVQETFLKLYHRPPPADHPLRAWLCRVALNLGRNALRSGRRDAARAERVAVNEAAADDPSAAAERSEARDLVRSALAALPERQARLLLLRHAGLSYAELAAVLDIAPGSVGTLLARAERAFIIAYEQCAGIRHEEPAPSLTGEVQP